MSVINKQPFIHKVIATLTKSNLTTLQGLLNGASTTIFKSYLNSIYAFSTEDKGINHCVFETENEVFTGYLIYNNSYCVLIAYKGNSQELKQIKIDYANKKYTIVDEELDINEFRRLVDNSKTDLVVELNDVIANPTLAGTEADLTGVEIDGTKYKVPQGGGSSNIFYMDVDDGNNYSDRSNGILTQTVFNELIDAIQNHKIIIFAESLSNSYFNLVTHIGMNQNGLSNGYNLYADMYGGSIYDYQLNIKTRDLEINRP